MPPIVIVGRFRYSNSKIMGVGHDWAEDNADLSWVKGLIKVDTFHISPDRGMAIYYFKKTEQAIESLPKLQNFFNEYSKMFECKITWEMGAFNETLSKKLTNHSK